MVFPTLFNLNLNVAIRSSWSEPQSTANLVFADCIELLHLQLKEYNQSDFAIDQLVMSMCSHLLHCWKRVFALTILFSWQNSVSFCPFSFCTPRQTCLLLQVSLDFLLLHSNPLWWKGCLCLVLVLESLVCLQRTGQLQLLWHQWLGHRIGLLWYWVIYLGNELRSFCHFWVAPKYCSGLFCWLWRLLHLF